MLPIACLRVLDSLHRRPRARPLAALLAQLTAGRVPAAPTFTPDEEALRRERTLAALRAHVPPTYDESPGPVTRALLERLGDDGAAAVETALDPATRHIWDTAPPNARERFKLVLGVHHGVPEVLERTGLIADTPPEDVHAMTRGAVGAGGDPWIADLVAGTAMRLGFGFPDGARVLDFGCSSARHLRVLQAWRPGVTWMGCDPNAGAIAWASACLPGIEFSVSPQEPPLDLDDGTLDAVFAISVWSHFGAGAATRWLGEMHRVLKPGGLLLMTTQGFASLAYYLRGGLVDDEHAASSAEALMRSGHAYRESFGPGGDWGVQSAEWGMAYLTLEWLAERALAGWTIEACETARVDTNQDLIALRRRPS